MELKLIEVNFEQTKYLKMKSKLTYVATFLILLSCSFKFDSQGVDWIWKDMIQVPIILVTAASILIFIKILKGKLKYGS